MVPRRLAKMNVRGSNLEPDAYFSLPAANIEKIRLEKIRQAEIVQRELTKLDGSHQRKLLTEVDGRREMLNPTRDKTISSKN